MKFQLVYKLIFEDKILINFVKKCTKYYISFYWEYYKLFNAIISLILVHIILINTFLLRSPLSRRCCSFPPSEQQSSRMLERVNVEYIFSSRRLEMFSEYKSCHLNNQMALDEKNEKILLEANEHFVLLFYFFIFLLSFEL